MANRFKSFTVICAVNLLLATALTLSCSDDPTSTGGTRPSRYYSWSEIDSFESGGRIAAICGDRMGNVFCGLLGLDRYGDGWSVHPPGSVVRYNGSSWSAPIYDIDATHWDLDMWASSASDVYLADGMLHHFDGRRWSDLGISADVIFGADASDVYIASTNDNKSVRHYDGHQWSLLREIGGDTNGDDNIVSIWAMSGPFVAVLRTHGISTWDGTSWTDVQFRDWDQNADVWGTAPGDLYVVGDPYSSKGHVIHFDGATWTYPEIPEVARLNSIWGSGPQDVYAVGERGAVLRYDGVAWMNVKRITTKALREIWGSSSSDVFAVGDDGKAIHFDGTTWTSIRKDKPDHHAWSIWAESATRFAVTNWIDGGTVYLYDNGQWKETLVETTGGIGTLAGHSLDDLYTLGDPGVFHYDGSEWTLHSYLDTYFPGEMWFPDGSDRGFAIGGGSIFQFNGAEWREVISGQPWYMASLWGASANCVYAINSQGRVFYYDGVTWRQIESPAGQLIDMWGVSSTEIYVLAGDINVPSGLFRYDGTAWHAVKAPSGPYGGHLVGNSSSNMFSWEGCWLSHFDGSKWQAECTPNKSTAEIVEAKDGSILRLTDDGISLQVPGFGPR